MYADEGSSYEHRHALHGLRSHFDPSTKPAPLGMHPTAQNVVRPGVSRFWSTLGRGGGARARERERETARLADDVENVPQVWRRRLMKSVIGNGKFTHCLRHWH